ncbi:MAG: 50S ribosomal protein L25/general stress protein Ctc [Pseudomonadota bacterium]
MMAKGFALNAAVRERTGKGAARALRREGLIPAVIYGNKEPPVAISIPLKETTLALYAGGFLTNLWTIDVDGKTVRALARDYQREPVKDRLVHVDFLRVSEALRVTVDVAVELTDVDTCPGLKAGGVLENVAPTITVEARAVAIPESIKVSLASLEIGHAITAADVALPDDVVAMGDETAVIAAVASTTSGAAPSAEEAAAESEEA